MTLNHRFTAPTLLLLTSFSLCGCFHHATPVTGSYPDPDNTANSSVTGAVAGTAASTLTQIGTFPGAALGSVVGGVTGLAQDSTDGLILKLQEQGILAYRLGDSITMVLPTDRFFEAGTPTITLETYSILNKVATILRKYPSSTIKIAGHSDDVGTPSLNKTLTQQRAESILTYLWVHGVPSQQMTAIGYGDAKPIASNRYLKGGEMNRRIEITVRRG